MKLMEAADVLQVLDHLCLAGIRVYVAGGWAIDALIGAQLRPHTDLDLAFDTDDESRVLKVLRRHGFQMTTDERPARFVLQDQVGRQIDFHGALMASRRGGLVIGGIALALMGLPGSRWGVASIPARAARHRSFCPLTRTVAKRRPVTYRIWRSWSMFQRPVPARRATCPTSSPVTIT